MRFLHWCPKPKPKPEAVGCEHEWVTFDKDMPEVRVCWRCDRIETRFLGIDPWIESNEVRLLWAVKHNAAFHQATRKAMEGEARQIADAKKELVAIHKAAGSWNGVLAGNIGAVKVPKARKKS